jgi:ribose 5-phosphate isomerase A
MRFEYMLAIVDFSKTSDQLEKEKQAVAKAALRYVRNNMLVGLGAGSTANYFVDFLAERVRSGELQIQAVASSLHTAARAREMGIPVSEPQRGRRVDLTIDGADEIAPDLGLIKGAGGALLREKIVARASRHFVVIGDSSKVVAQLGRRPVPLEVTPFATPWIMDEVEELGGHPTWRMDKSKPDRPCLTDQQNYLIDCDFGLIADPHDLAVKLKTIPGIVEHGLFLGLASAALVADGNDVLVLRPRYPPMPIDQCDLAFD